MFRHTPHMLISDIRIAELDASKVEDLPGMVVYVVQPGDNLWNIGKKYYVSVDRIKAINELVSEDIMPGEKLLIVKGA